MELQITDSEAYRRLFARPLIAFDSVAFNALNAAKAVRVMHVLLSEGGKTRFGLIVGEREDGSLSAPFSAPFAALEAIGKQRVEHYVAAAQALKEWLRAEGRALRLTLPPSCYGEEIARQTATFLSAGAQLLWADYNYHFQLSDFPRLDGMMDSKVRNKLGLARRQGYAFETRVPLAEAHAVILENHNDRGYPTHLSADDLEATARIIKIDTFGLRKDGELAAAAIVYRTTADAAQVIYWGDRPAARAGHPMHLLAYEVFGHYARHGFRIVDPGPSSSEGIPSPGLCDFKSSIGCRLSLKPTLRLL